MNKFSRFHWIPPILILISLLIFLTSCQSTQLSPSGIQQTVPDDGSALVIDSEDDEGSVVFIIEIAIVLLFISSLVGIVTRRLRVPYTV
ncbi:MAG: hypothetical protein ACQEQQ_01170, partial [Chloroflexota bacterium]